MLLIFKNLQILVGIILTVDNIWVRLLPTFDDFLWYLLGVLIECVFDIFCFILTHLWDLLRLFKHHLPYWRSYFLFGSVFILKLAVRELASHSRRASTRLPYFEFFLAWVFFAQGEHLRRLLIFSCLNLCQSRGWRLWDCNTTNLSSWFPLLYTSLLIKRGWALLIVLGLLLANVTAYLSLLLGLVRP